MPPIDLPEPETPAKILLDKAETLRNRAGYMMADFKRYQVQADNSKANADSLLARAAECEAAARALGVKLVRVA
jgi:hypothetical protein